MKPTWQFIVSPFAFALLGFLIAGSIAKLAPTNPSNAPVLVGLPLIGSAIGWFFAYLATPSHSK